MISIIIATKNGGRFLARAISSIEKQSERDFEVIIVSDGSTDDTVAIATKLASDYPYIKVIELRENIGPGLARNKGIREAKGEYIALLDDDDEWVDTDKLKNQKEYLDQNKEYVLVGSTETDFIKEDGELLFTYEPKKTDLEIRRNLLLMNQFITSSVMFRKQKYVEVGGFAHMYLAEDYDLWLRMAKVGKVANLDKTKTRYYTRSSGAHRSNIIKMNKVIIVLVKKYGKDFPNYYPALIKSYLRLWLKNLD